MPARSAAEVQWPFDIEQLLHPPADLEKTITKIVMGFGEVWIDFQSSLEVSNCLVHPPYLGKNYNQDYYGLLRSLG